MTPKHIIMHHSATKDSGTVSWQAIRQYHVETNGWKNVGYHCGVELITHPCGISRNEILLGRPLTQGGAHCLGMNDKSLGICLIGNFDEEHPSPDKLKLAAELVRSLMEIFRIPKDQVLGHREAAKGRTCPGKNFDMDLFRGMLGK